MTTVKRVIKPHPGPQTEFLECPLFEVLYGGARSGGKSHALVLDPLGQVHLSDYRAVIFRRTYNELDGLIRLAQDIYTTAYPGVKFNKTERKFYFPSGATIEFTYCQNMEDARKWQGKEIQYLGIDELGNFDKEVYDFLKTCVRYGGIHKDEMKMYVRATCNPEGRGLQWIKAYFVDPAPKGKTPIPNDNKGVRYRMFIPARVTDNPSVNKEYITDLENLPEKQRRALLYGEWDVWAGSFFNIQKGVHIWTWDQFRKFYRAKGIKIEDNEFIPKSWPRFMSCDWGYSAPFSFGWYATDPFGRLILYREYCGVAKDEKGNTLPNTGVRLSYRDVASVIRKLEDKEFIHMRVLDGAEFSKTRGDRVDDGPTGAEMFANEGLFFIPCYNKDIRQGCLEIHRRFDYRMDEDGNITEYPYLVFIDEETPNHQRSFLSIESDPTEPDKYDTRQPDHDIDQTRYMVMMRPFKALHKEDKPNWYKGFEDNRDGNNNPWAEGM